MIWLALSMLWILGNIIICSQPLPKVVSNACGLDPPVVVSSIKLNLHLKPERL